MWLNDFEFDVIWTAFQLLLKLHSHISVLWPFCRISVISGFPFLRIGLKTKTRKSRKILIFGSIKFKWMWTCFLITILNFWLLKLKYTKATNPINLDGLEALKGQIRGTWLEIWLNRIEIFVIWRTTAFQATLSYFSIMAFLQNFCDFRVFVFRYRAQNENPEITENVYFWIYKVQMDVNLCFDHYFNFLSVKTETNKQKKQTQFNKSRGVRFSWKATIWHTISKVAELFWQQCHLNNISRVLEITFSYFNILGFLMNFLDFRVIVMGYRAQNEKPEITENLCL